MHIAPNITCWRVPILFMISSNVYQAGPIEYGVYLPWITRGKQTTRVYNNARF